VTPSTLLSIVVEPTLVRSSYPVPLYASFSSLPPLAVSALRYAALITYPFVRRRTNCALTAAAAMTASAAVRYARPPTISPMTSSETKIQIAPISISLAQSAA
jgi:hypothetical protein